MRDIHELVNGASRSSPACGTPDSLAPGRLNGSGKLFKMTLTEKDRYQLIKVRIFGFIAYNLSFVLVFFYFIPSR